MEKISSKSIAARRNKMSYQNFNRMVMNETKSIHYETLDKLSTILECPIGDLFEKAEDEPDPEE